MKNQKNTNEKFSTYLGVTFGWLLLLFMTIGNPNITNNSVIIILIIMTIGSSMLALTTKQTLKNKIITVFKIILTSVITIYLTLFTIYFLTIFLNV